MPSWKKLITSGSSALLLNVTASSFTGSFTGSFLGTGSYATNALSASYAPSSTTINNNTNNYVITGTGTNGTLNGESNLTFDGTTLTVTGNIVETSTQKIKENIVIIPEPLNSLLKLRGVT